MRIKSFFDENMGRLRTSVSALPISLRDRIHLAAQLIAFPTVLFALCLLLGILEEASGPTFHVYHVIAKIVSAPNRYIIEIRTKPNKNGGTMGSFQSYPKWLFDRVEVGDVFYPAPGHICVTGDGWVKACYVPWQDVFPLAWLPLIWCMPSVLWLFHGSWTRSIPVLVVALAIELSFASTIAWAILF